MWKIYDFGDNCCFTGCDSILQLGIVLVVESGICALGWSEIDGQCWRLTTAPVNFSSALEGCAGENGTLGTVGSFALAASLRLFVGPLRTAWLGGLWGVDGGWRWLDGSPVAHNEWTVDADARRRIPVGTSSSRIMLNGTSGWWQVHPLLWILKVPHGPLCFRCPVWSGHRSFQINKTFSRHRTSRRQ